MAGPRSQALFGAGFPVDDRQGAPRSQEAAQLVERGLVVVDLVPDVDGDDGVGPAVGQGHAVVRGVDELDGGQRLAGGAARLEPAAQLVEQLGAAVDRHDAAMGQHRRERQGGVAEPGAVVDHRLGAVQGEQPEHGFDGLVGGALGVVEAGGVPRIERVAHTRPGSKAGSCAPRPPLRAARDRAAPAGAGRTSERSRGRAARPSRRRRRLRRAGTRAPCG